MLLGTCLAKTRRLFQPVGVQAFANIDDISMAFFDLAATAVEAMPFLKNSLRHLGIASTTPI